MDWSENSVNNNKKTKNGRLESSVMVRFHSGISVSPAGTKTQPESKPPVSGSQGLAKVDWVTEWFPGLRNVCKNEH